MSTNTSVSVVASSGTAGAPGAVSMVANTGAFIQLGSQMWTYAAASNITSVTPSIGQIGTLVTISGSNLLGQGTTVASVSLVGVLAIVASADNFKITVVAASHPLAQIGDVVVTSNTGATATHLNGWQYGTAGSITTIVPANGQVGTFVTINGLFLKGYGASVASVTLCGFAASIMNQTDSWVVVEAGTGSVTATLGSVVITSSSGATTAKPNSFTYVVLGEITDVNPPSGAPGTRVTISGLNLCGGGASITNVTLGGFAATIATNPASSCARVIVIVIDYGLNTFGNIVLTTNSHAIITSLPNA